MYRVSHTPTNFVYNDYEAPHQLEDGSVCIATYTRWEHVTICGRCGYNYQDYYMDNCICRHSICTNQDSLCIGQ